MSDYEQIVYSVERRVATITMNRPDKLNALTHLMFREMIDAFDRTDADDEVRVVIVTGAGRAFCAGADLTARRGLTFAPARASDESATGSNGNVARDAGGLLTLRIFESKKPVIAAINGVAAGGGVTMTLPMDIRLASDTARFTLPFARRGIVPEAASSWFLPRVVGISQAAEWCYTGRTFSAEEAKDGRLVRSVHPPDELLPAAHALAAEIADNTAPVSVALTRQMLWRMLGADHPMEAHRVDSRALAARGRSADAQEGVLSFLEKRPPNFPHTIGEGLPEVFPDWDEPTFS